LSFGRRGEAREGDEQELELFAKIAVDLSDQHPRSHCECTSARCTCEYESSTYIRLRCKVRRTTQVSAEPSSSCPFTRDKVSSSSRFPFKTSTLCNTPFDLRQPSCCLMEPARPDSPRLRQSLSFSDLALLVCELVLLRQQSKVYADLGGDGGLTKKESEAKRPLDVHLRRWTFVGYASGGGSDRTPDVRRPEERSRPRQ
jgi:hypothetical protein